MSALQKWFVKLKTILRRTMTKINTNRMDLTDQEKKLLMKMRLEEKEIHQSPVPYNVTDPNEEKGREELKEKLRRRKEVVNRFLEVCYRIP